MRRIHKGIASLLKKNLSVGQLIGFSIANLIGLTVILSGILFYCDSRHRQKTDDKFFSDDYIVISKKVKGLSLEPISFTSEEIEEIKSQPWVKKLGEFTPADFSVSASVNMGGRGMSTYLFLESVPNEFFDVIPDSWEFTPEKKFVPVVLNKDYLALYNFGFALPRGLPQLSEDMIGSVPLKLYMMGENGQSDIFDASVVGFSSRLNTIAVPQDFMDWANRRYSTQESPEISRLIIKIDRLNSSEAETFIANHSLEIAGDKENDSKLSEFLGLVAGIMAATGFVIAVLAVFILLLSIFLLLQKSRPMLRNLLLLGYSPQQTARYYELLVINLNLGITLVAVGLTFVVRLIWHDSLRALGLGDANVMFMVGAALIYFILISLINIIVIRHHLLKTWKS